MCHVHVSMLLLLASRRVFDPLKRELQMAVSPLTQLVHSCAFLSEQLSDPISLL